MKLRYKFLFKYIYSSVNCACVYTSNPGAVIYSTSENMIFCKITLMKLRYKFLSKYIYLFYSSVN